MKIEAEQGNGGRGLNQMIGTRAAVRVGRSADDGQQFQLLALSKMIGLSTLTNDRRQCLKSSPPVHVT